MTTRSRYTAAVKGKNIRVYDTFTGADGVEISTRQPDINPYGAAWTPIASLQKIYSNTAQSDGDGGATINAGVSDCIITTRIKLSYAASGINTRQNSILFRYNGTNYWKLRANVNDDTLALFNPAGSAVASTAVNLTEYGLADLVLYLDGAKITGEIFCLDGTHAVVSTVDTTNQTATKHGFWLFRRGYGPTYIDDFTITDW